MKLLPATATQRLLPTLVALTLACAPQPSDPLDGSGDVVDSPLGGDLDGGDLDGGVREAGPPCERTADCDDGLFCNGAETCRAGACIAGRPPCPGAECSETIRTCPTLCETPDADADGRRAVACGGDDCDDDDPNAFPGNPEVCDADAHDEDCDPLTFGFRDTDGDDAPDARCCNTTFDGTPNCGSDCDDMRRGVNPDVPEVCNGRDDDCDTAIDEGASRAFYPDADGDGFGDARATPVAGCLPRSGQSEDGTDCDDTRRAINPGAGEACDGIDSNCNGMLEGVGEDQDSDLDWSGCGRIPADCDDTNAAVGRGATEICDGLDNDCNGRLDGPGEDDDGDGFADAACGGLDCNDGDAAFHPGAPERCDGRDTNCDGMPTTADADRDGHGAAGCGGDDCDDTRPTVYAGAPELCDNLDNDCDRLLDGPGEDGDRDGFASSACGGRDCNDASSAFFPGAREVCDGRDTNCDGRSNANDDDGDSFGDAACGGTDCDDTRSAVHPGAPEICNGLDDDCSGAVDGPLVDCAGDTPFCSATADRCVAVLPCGDGVLHPGEECDDGNLQDHDGCSRLCIDEPRLVRPLSLSVAAGPRPIFGWTWDLRPARAAFVVLCQERDCRAGTERVEFPVGPEGGGTVRPAAPLSAGSWFWRVERRAADGAVVASTHTWLLHVPNRATGEGTSAYLRLPDVNADGLSDIVHTDFTGAPDFLGRVRVYFGRVGGPSSTPDQTVVVSDPTPTWSSGAAHVGDVDGDGYGDVFVTNGARLLRGGPSGLDAPIAAPAGLAPDRTAFSSGGMRSVGGPVGDADGDGFTDLIVTAGSTVGLRFGGRGGVFGAAVALQGPRAGGVSSPSWCQWAVLDDVTGDGVADLFARCAYAVAPFAANWFVPGPFDRSGRGSTPVETAPQGALVVPVGDVNGDGFGDAMWDTTVIEGAVVTPGSAAGLVAPLPAFAELLPPAGGGGGTCLRRAAFDVDADGIADTEQATTGTPYDFRCWAIRAGRTSGPAATQQMFSTIGSTTPAAMFVGDVNGDGRSDGIEFMPTRSGQSGSGLCSASLGALILSCWSNGNVPISALRFGAPTLPLAATPWTGLPFLNGTLALPLW